mgnify:CR=1 FL=1
MIISAPPFRHPCFFGTDIPERNQLLAHNRTVEEMREIIGVEVKAAATVQARDFKGLRRLQAHTGKDFITGIVLYDGDKALSFGDGMWAVPLAAL